MTRLLRRHGIVIGVTTVFVLVFALLLPSILGRDAIRDHSAHRKNPWGCAALAELCSAVDPRLNVKLIEQPLDDLEAIEGLLLIIDPEQGFSPDELGSLVRWVKAGGILIAAMEGEWDDPASVRVGEQPAHVGLAAALGVRLVDREKREEVARPVRRSPLGDGVDRVAVRTRYAIAPFSGPGLDDTGDGLVCLVPHEEGDLTPHLVANGGTILASFEHGEGRVFVSSDTEMFANRILAREDNLAFVANLIWPHAAGRTVYFDEYHHGFGERALAGSATDPGPLNRATLAAIVGCAIFLIGKAVRFGSPVPVFDARRRTAMEYVEALADLFRRGRANGWALERIAAALKHRLSAGAGLPGTASWDALADSLAERRDVPTDQSTALFRDIEEAMAGTGPSSRRLTSLVDRIAALEERARPNPHARRSDATQRRPR